MSYISTIVFFFAFAFNCYCDVVSLGGKCVSSPVMNDFDPKRFQGIWYESMRFPNIYEGDDDDTVCVKNEFKYIDSQRMSFNATSYKPFLGSDSTFNGDLTLAKQGESNKFNVKYDVDFFGLSTFNLDGKFDIWDTDYKTYALIYSCSPYKVFILNFKTEAVWILSRTKQQLPESTLQKLRAQLDSKKLNSTQLQAIDQDCESN